MTHNIKIIDSGLDRYLLEPNEIVTLGRQWDSGADEIAIERPEAEKDSLCVMIINDISGNYIDHIIMNTDSYTIKSNVSMNKYIKISFRFLRQDGYSKGSEILIGKFLTTQKPYDFKPDDPAQKEDIDYLVGFGFTDSKLDGNELQFFNMFGNKVVAFDLSPFVQAQSDLGETDQTAETFVKGKKTSNLVNDGEDGTSPFATVAYVKDKLEIIKTDGKGDKYLADDGVYKEVRTNRSFNDNWKINGTTLEFIQSVLADEAATVGMSFLGGVNFSDLPVGLGNAECLVEIISSTLGSDEKVIHLDLYSSDTSPYHWSTIYYRQLLDPIWQPDVLQSDVDKKLDKTGGTISGNLSVQGNLNVAGTTVTQDTETLLVKDNIVVTNSDKADLINLSGLAINKNANQTYGIMYDPTTDSVKLGLGSIDETGKFTFSENGNPVAVRADSSLLVDGHLIKWDATNNRFVDSGKSVDDFVLKGEIKQDYQIVTEEPEDKSQGKMIYEKSSGVTLGKAVVDKTAGAGQYYSSPSDLVDKIFGGTAVPSDIETYEYLLFRDGAYGSPKEYVGGYINIGDLPELTQYALTHDSIEVIFKVNNGAEQSDILTKNSDGSFGNASNKFQTMKSQNLVEGAGSDYYTLDLQAGGGVAQSFKVAETDTIQITKLKLGDAYINIDKGGSEGTFAITNLKIADGTKYNSLKDLFNEGMQEKLTAGTGITIENNIISATAQETQIDNSTITKTTDGKLQAVGLQYETDSKILTAHDIWLACSIEREV